MGIEVLEREIGGLNYRVTLLPTKLGTATLVRLVKLFGPTLGSFIGGIGRGVATPGLGEQDLAEHGLAQGAGDAINAFCARLDEVELQRLLDLFAQYTVVEIDAQHEPRLDKIFDDHFAGRYDLLFTWFRFALEVNYTRFFIANAGGIVAQMWKALSRFRSRGASTGTSTASPAASDTAAA